MYVHLIHDQELKCAVNSARHAVHELERHLNGLQRAIASANIIRIRTYKEFCPSFIISIAHVSNATIVSSSRVKQMGCCVVQRMMHGCSS